MWNEETKKDWNRKIGCKYLDLITLNIHKTLKCFFIVVLSIFFSDNVPSPPFSSVSFVFFTFVFLLSSYFHWNPVFNRFKAFKSKRQNEHFVLLCAHKQSHFTFEDFSIRHFSFYHIFIIIPKSTFSCQHQMQCSRVHDDWRNGNKVWVEQINRKSWMLKARPVINYHANHSERKCFGWFLFLFSLQRRKFNRFSARYLFIVKSKKGELEM